MCPGRLKINTLNGPCVKVVPLRHATVHEFEAPRYPASATGIIFAEDYLVCVTQASQYRSCILAFSGQFLFYMVFLEVWRSEPNTVTYCF